LWAYRITEGHYGNTPMAGLNVVLLSGFDGNLWADTKIDCGFFFDAAADDEQRDALVKIFTGQVGGWMSQFVPAHVKGVTGIEFAEIELEIDDDLERWHVRVDERVEAGGSPMRGPTSDPTKLLQSFNPPGSEVGPTDAPVTWGKGKGGRWSALGFQATIPAGQASKHIPFDWHGPEQS
jgi:hypothetical protein